MLMYGSLQRAKYHSGSTLRCLQAPKGSLWKHMVMLDNDNFAAAWDSTVQFINASTGQVTATIEQAHDGPIRYMQFARSKMKAGGCCSAYNLLLMYSNQIRQSSFCR